MRRPRIFPAIALIRFLGYVRPHLWLVAGGSVMGILKFTLPLAFPLAFKYVFDVLLVPQPRLERVNQLIDRLCGTIAATLHFGAGSAAKLEALTAALFVLFLVTLGTLRYSRLATFSALWIAITLLPVSHLIPYPEMMAEHYLYIPSFGFCLLVALLLARLTESPRSKVQGPRSFFSFLDLRRETWDLKRWWMVVGYGLFVIFLIFYARRTVIRNRDWRDDLTFYNCMVRDNPYSARARLGLGYAYDRSGLPRMAIVQYQAGLRLDPQDPRLYTNLGAAHQKLGELREAEQVYKDALKLRFQDLKILNNLGFLYAEKREFDKARSTLEKAEKLSQGRNSTVYANFGLLYELQNKLPEALEAYRKARTLDPDNAVYAQRIAVLEKNLATQGQGAGENTEKGQPGSP